MAHVLQSIPSYSNVESRFKKKEVTMKKLLAVLVMVFTMAIASNAKGAALVNGSFETGDLTGWTSDTTWGVNPFGTSLGSGMDGQWWAWLGGYEEPLYMEQTVTGLTAGTTYGVNFIMASEHVLSDSLFVSADGGASQMFTAPPKNNNFWDNWVSREFDFTATGTTAAIRFSTYGVDSVYGYGHANNTQYDVGFDNVTISAKSVPEPSTLLLLGSGMVGLALTRIRKFRKNA